MSILISGLALAMMQTSALAQSNLAAPPETRSLPSKCRCEADARESDFSFTGIVVDAEMRLAANGRDADPRQATVFRVTRGKKNVEADIVKVWHVTNPDECGVVFDYGRRYIVAVKETENGLETDYCIDPRFEREATPPASDTEPAGEQ